MRDLKLRQYYHFRVKAGLRTEAATGGQQQTMMEDLKGCIQNFRNKNKSSSRIQAPYFRQPRTSRPHQSIITTMQMGELIMFAYV